MTEIERTSSAKVVPVLAGIGAVLLGYALSELPTVLVARGHVSVFEAARSKATLMHVTPGCGGCKSALADYRSDPSVRAVVIPVALGPDEGEAPDDFQLEICRLARDGLRERGAWWIAWVDADVACRSLWAGEREFVDAHPVVAWPQFSRDDALIRSFDPDALREVGLEQVVGADGKRRVRALQNEEPG